MLALLLGSATFALFVLGFVSEEPDRPVPELSVTVAMALAAASLGLFVVFLHHAVRSLNASAVIRRRPRTMRSSSNAVAWATSP